MEITKKGKNINNIKWYQPSGGQLRITVWKLLSSSPNSVWCVANALQTVTVSTSPEHRRQATSVPTWWEDDGPLSGMEPWIRTCQAACFWWAQAGHVVGTACGSDVLGDLQSQHVWIGAHNISESLSWSVTSSSCGSPMSEAQDPSWPPPSCSEPHHHQVLSNRPSYNV